VAAARRQVHLSKLLLLPQLVCLGPCSVAAARQVQDQHQATQPTAQLQPLLATATTAAVVLLL
jgi:hypothetical protein